METLSHYSVTLLLSGLTFLMIYKPFCLMANKLGLVDIPNQRKKHEGAIPLIGGILIFVSSTAGLIFSTAVSLFDPYLQMVVGAGGALLLVGIIDDRFDVSALLKLIMQFILAHIAIVNGFRIGSFYGILGIYELTEVASYIVTLLAVVGFVNAFNLMDGIDGLAGSFALLSVVIMAWVAFYLVQSSAFVVLLSLCIPLILFLKYNLKEKKKIFMGDAGSLFLGFLIIITSIRLINAAAPLNKGMDFIALILSIVALPIMDSIRVYLLRINKGRSPFAADRTHLHHLFLKSGYTPKKSTFYIISLTLLVLIIVVLNNENTSINGLLIAMVLGFVTLISLLRYGAYMKEWTEKIKKL
ncbi:MAG: UDP-GlcNAc:undecaprenyl-phosphate GlcNAc-1-phosphate transferase [Marivirga sp.]|jgi:UDP-GlcNAc:undecaprenyl-phosphate GlcNAc-1-phosphate transferase